MPDSSALWTTFCRSLLLELAPTHVEDLPGAQTHRRDLHTAVS